MAKLTTQQWGSVMDSGTQLVELGMEASTPSTWSSRGEVARDTVKGTLKGAAAGAALGSIIPGIGTGIGAIGGALIGFGGQAFKNGSVEGRNFADASQIQLKRGGWLGNTPWAEFRDAKDTAAGNRAALITGQRNAAEYSENADNDVAVLGRANGGEIPETPILVSKGEVYVDNEGNAEIIGGKKHKHNGKDDKVKIAKVGGFVYANSKAMEYENGETPADDAIKRLNTKKIKKVDRYSLGTLAALKLNAKILANKAEQLKEEKGLKNRPKKLVLTAKFGDPIKIWNSAPTPIEKLPNWSSKIISSDADEDIRKNYLKLKSLNGVSGNSGDSKLAAGLGIASSIFTNLAPVFSNAMAKAETEQPIYNPYMSLALATKRNLRAKANTRALREQQAISNYNANNLGTGQGLALRRQSAVDLNKAISDMYLQTQLQNNTYADNYANALINAGNAYAAETRATREINAQNRAAQDTFRNKALSEGVAYLQGKKRDMATLNAMYPMLLSAYPEDQLKSMLLNYLMS